jgi:isopropylmalate/homocitrate/citramalate synthase
MRRHHHLLLRLLPPRSRPCSRPLSAQPYRILPTNSRALEKGVKIVEVGPRDGLQNEPGLVSAQVKLDLVRKLAKAGLPVIEATAFVNATKVPQMADAMELMSSASEWKRSASTPALRSNMPVLQALVPNLLGLERAKASGADEVSVFTAASEAFAKRNINCSIRESVERFRPVLEAAREANMPVRGYVSCAMGCPYEGKVASSTVAAVAEQLFELGCYEVSIADTIGVGTPGEVQNLLHDLRRVAPVERLAVHFHDTYGMALTNILTALNCGVNTIDAAVGGLGGCPFAPGATGNVATEDVIYMLQGLGVQTGVSIEDLLDATLFITDALGRKPESRVARAMLAKRRKSSLGDSRA